MTDITEEEFKEWRELKIQISKNKIREMLLRKRIALMVSFKPGTNTLNLFGTTVKVVHKESFKLDQEKYEIYYDEMSKEEQAAVEFKPALKLKQYKALPVGNKLQMFCVTRTDSAPTVTIKEY